MRNSFIVRLAAGLFLAAFGITGAPAAILAIPICWLLGEFVDRGILQIDITINAVKTGLQMKEFEKLAQQAHDKATARVYSEEEKNAIRQQYLDAIRDFARFGKLPNG